MTRVAPLLPDATRDLAGFAAGLRFDDVPPAVTDHAKLYTLDGLGVALFGAGLPWTAHVRGMAVTEEATPAALFWGTDHRGTVARAALVNGTAGHAFEMDDIHKESIVHPNSLAVPVALAFADGLGGVSGQDVLEAGYGGILSSTSGNPKPERLTAGLGTTWKTAEVGFKLYPSVTSIHTELDALDTVMTEQGLAVGDIDRVSVGCSHMTFVHTAWPYKPAGVTAVQMNLFYGLAMIALHRDASVRRYSEAGLADSTAMAFMRPITAFKDPDLEAMGAAFRHACRLEVATKDGPILRHERLARRGSPEDAVGSRGWVRRYRS